MRYFLEISYNGKNYHGWQIQPNASSVQETLERCLSLLLHEEISLTGAGRTDTGVHARQLFAHFDTGKLLDNNLIAKLNRFLPPDIAIHQLLKVSDDAHARFDATFRKYQYYISTQKNPFVQESAWQLIASLDVEKMNEAAKILFQHTDFTSFSKLHTDVKTNNCVIYEAHWVEEPNGLLCFHIKADRFLRNMVRAIVGTLVEVGRGKLSIEDFNQIIVEKNRQKAGASVPPQGLFLVEVGYNYINN